MWTFPLQLFGICVLNFSSGQNGEMQLRIVDGLIRCMNGSNLNNLIVFCGKEALALILSSGRAQNNYQNERIYIFGLF